MKPIVFLTLLAVLALAGTAASSTEPAPKRAIVTWKVGDETFRTYLNRAADIAVVRRAIKAGETAGIPIGRIYRGRRENGGYAWHLRDVRLAEVTIELCDGRPSDLDADLDYWVGSVKRYCPWGAVPAKLRWVPA